MHSIPKLSDTALLIRVSELAQEERNLTLEILHLLREVEARSLHLKRGYASLHEYAIKELKYSGGAAHRRVSAMRLLKSVPQAEEAIEKGDLTLSNVSLVQTFLRAEERETQRVRSAEEKGELLMSMAGRSRRECERQLMEIAPEVAVNSERVRSVSTDQSRVHVTLESELLRKFERIRQLASHRIGDESIASLLAFMADLTLEQLERKVATSKKPSPKTPPAGSVEPGDARGPVKAVDPVKAKEPAEQPGASVPTKRADFKVQRSSRHIPAEARRLVWHRAQGRCEYESTRPGHTQRCASRRFLQIDHRHPFALGGPTSVENLRLLCQAHNRLEAERFFGRAKVPKAAHENQIRKA